MPQLDPAPWFMILMALWLIFLIVSPMKVTKYQHLNDPAPKTLKAFIKPWPWPWS